MVILNRLVQVHQTGRNAAKNNVLFLIPVAYTLLEITDKLLTAKDAYDLAKAVETGDTEKVEQLTASLAFGLATEAAPGNKIVQKALQSKYVQKIAQGVKNIFGKKADNIDVAGVPKGGVKTPKGGVTTPNKLPDVIAGGGKTWNKTKYNGRSVYKNDGAFDVNHVDSKGRTNVQRMGEGLAPIGKDGKSVELHHMTQSEVNGFNGSRGAVAEVF